MFEMFGIIKPDADEISSRAWLWSEMTLGSGMDKETNYTYLTLKA